MAKFLVVDDDEIQRNIISMRINKLGHSVIAYAEDGYEAYEKYKLYKPDYVTMDILIPKRKGIDNGIQALKLIKSFDKNAQIIMISSLGEEKLVMEALISGAKTFLIKPITEENLKAALDYSIKSLL